MRFKNRQSGSQMPEVNLVPMMDVLMTVLTFFIIISMTLTGQQIFNVNLPQTRPTDAGEDGTPSFVVGLDSQKQIILDNQPISREQLIQQMQAYLAQNSQGQITLQADRALTYEDVAQLLETMRDVGGDRVLLAIEGN